MATRSCNLGRGFDRWSQEVAKHLDRWLHHAGHRRDVFVVYGRNIAARNAVYSFLRSLGLNPLEWDELVRAVGKGAPYVGDVLDQGFARTQACVVLFTGDERVGLRRELRDGEELGLQPRPNVLFEAGMALAHHPDRTLIVQLGPLRAMSDLTGRHFVQLDDSEASRRTFAERLRTAECEVRMDGKWQTAGDFAGAFRYN